MTEYTSRPTQRRARVAWDYFMAANPWMNTTKRELRLGYSPNLDYYGPGWYMNVATVASDTLYWRGGQEICYKVHISSLLNWESENR